MPEEPETPNLNEPPTPTEPAAEPTTSLITEPPKIEEPKIEPVEPIKFDELTIPEGYNVVEPLKDKFLEILNGELSPKDRANALLDLHKQTTDAALEADSSAWDGMQEEWKNEAKAEFGAELQPTLTNIAKLIDEYGSPELRGAFDLTGAGNNPHVIKFLGKIAGVLTEGTHVGGTSNVQLTEAQKAARLYPSMKG